MDPLFIAGMFFSSWLAGSLFLSLIIRLTSPILVKPHVTLNSAFIGDLAAVPVWIAITGLVALLLNFTASKIFDGQGWGDFAAQGGRAGVALFVIIAAAPGYLAASFVSAKFMRKKDGGRVSFVDACKVHAAPVLLFWVYWYVTRPGG